MYIYIYIASYTTVYQYIYTGYADIYIIYPNLYRDSQPPTRLLQTYLLAAGQVPQAIPPRLFFCVFFVDGKDASLGWKPYLEE